MDKTFLTFNDIGWEKLVSYRISSIMAVEIRTKQLDRKVGFMKKEFYDYYSVYIIFNNGIEREIYWGEDYDDILEKKRSIMNIITK